MWRMAKYKYEAEYEFDTSVKIIYPYLMPQGLKKWLAEEVIENQADNTFTIIWDDEPHCARLMHKRINKSLRYLFLGADHNTMDKPENIEEANYLDFQLNRNEMTETIFLQVTDYSDMNNEDELREVWESLIYNLRESLKNRSKIT